MATPTREQVRAAFDLMVAVTEVIRDVKEIPSGVLYARLMDKLSFPAYMAMLESLQRTKLIEVKSHVIYWVGPNLPAGK